MVTAMPPLPEPSSLVTIMPSSGLALWNSLAWLSALVPVVASTTKQREVRCGGVLLGEGAADFPELLHQVVAGVDAAGGVADQEFRAVGDGLLVGVEADRGRVGVGIALTTGRPRRFAPALELLDGGGAEGVGGGEDHRKPALFEPQAELGGGGGFAGAVHADDEDDEGFAIGAGQAEAVIAGQALWARWRRVVSTTSSAETSRPRSRSSSMMAVVCGCRDRRLMRSASRSSQSTSARLVILLKSDLKKPAMGRGGAEHCQRVAFPDGHPRS
jgi:hypothetical protein